MSLRHPQAALRALARRAREAWSSAPVRPAAGGAVAARIFGALETPAQAGAAPPPCRLPACLHLPAALAAAREGPPAAAALADAFAVFTPALAWFRRPGAEPGPDRFFDGHANAQLVGPRGFARRDDVVAGVSLLAPGVRYPDHWHPPEEIYLVLSPGVRINSYSLVEGAGVEIDGVLVLSNDVPDRLRAAVLFVAPAP